MESRFNINPDVDVWINFNEAIEWCQKNCKDAYEISIDGDSAIFAFEHPDDALIFSIKFKK